MSERASGSTEAVTPEAKTVAPMPLQVVVGRQLGLLRHERGLSREALATRVGLPVGHIEEHERGTRRIGVNQLLIYASLLDVRLSAFFSEPPASGAPAEGRALSFE
jgi:transcriptional regulator with XRE-family HTH domain